MTNNFVNKFLQLDTEFDQMLQLIDLIKTKPEEISKMENVVLLNQILLKAWSLKDEIKSDMEFERGWSETLLDGATVVCKIMSGIYHHSQVQIDVTSRYFVDVKVNNIVES